MSGFVGRDHVELQQVAVEARELVDFDERLDVAGEQLVALGVVVVRRGDGDAVVGLLREAEAEVVGLDPAVAVAGLSAVAGLDQGEQAA